jgi:hypothetical protein
MVRLLILLGLRYARLALVMRYAPRLLDAVLRERVPHPLVRRPIVYWLVRRLFP